MACSMSRSSTTAASLEQSWGPWAWSDFGISSSLEVRENDQYGRGVYAGTAFSLGAQVMQAKPFTHVLSNDVRGQMCHFCLGESKSLLKCGRCKFVRYCNKDCQRGDWKWHGGECRGIAAVLPHMPTPLVRLVVRWVHILSEERSKLASDILCSHRERLSPEVKENLATLMIGIKMLLNTPDSAIMDQAYSVLCKALCNTFTIHRADLDEIGAGLYGGPSLLNHSCMPNCVAVFNGTTLTIRTIKPIQSGEQLLISYVDLLEEHQERERVLERSYCFQCKCERCLTEYNSHSPCHTMYAAGGNSSENAVREVTKVGIESLKKVKNHRKKGDWAEMVTECELSLTRQVATLHHMHHVTVSTLQQLVYACIEAGEWDKAITASRKLTGPLECYLPEYHPVLAVHLLRLGKLFRLSGSSDHLQLSVTYLRQAVQKLRVVYGEDNSSTLEALEMLHDSQRELRLRDSA